MAKSAAAGTEVKRFGVRDKIGYAMGDAGNDFTFMLASTFMLKFYTDVMGVSAALVGTLMMLARFVDAVTDTAMGQLVDRMPDNPRGRFLPWIRRFMGPVALMSFLLYASWFADMPMGFKIFWMFFTYLLWGSVCYTGVNIPYGSMASAVTDNPEERTQLSVWRNVGAAVGGGVISVVLPMVVYYTDEAGNTQLSGTKMAIAAFGCSIGALICYLLCVNLSTERITIPRKVEKFSLGGLLKQLFSSRALLSIIVAAILLLLAQLTMTGMNAYIFPGYFNSAMGQSLSTVCGGVVMLVLALFVIPPLSKKFGKKEVTVVGTIIAVIAYIILFLIHTTSMWVYIIGYTFGYFGVAFFTTLCWAMITDVIDEDNVRRGTRSDGTIYSLYSFARKVGQALSSGLTGWLLGMIGYSTETAFDPDVLDGIYKTSTIVPAVGFLLMIIVLAFWYPLNKKRVDENAAKLAEMRSRESAEIDSATENIAQ